MSRLAYNAGGLLSDMRGLKCESQIDSRLYKNSKHTCIHTYMLTSPQERAKNP